MGVDYTLDAADDEEEKEEDEDTNERVEASDSPAKEKDRLEKLLKEHREKECEKQERQQYLLDQQLKRRPIPKEAKSVRSNTKGISPTMEEMDVEIKSNALVNAVKNELDNQAAGSVRNKITTTYEQSRGNSKAFSATCALTWIKKKHERICRQPCP